MGFYVHGLGVSLLQLDDAGTTIVLMLCCMIGPGDEDNIKDPGIWNSGELVPSPRFARRLIFRDIRLRA